jgi:hypothetical protein
MPSSLFAAIAAIDRSVLRVGKLDAARGIVNMPLPQRDLQHATM